MKPIDKTGITSVWGGRGAGKSYFARNTIIPQISSQRVVIIDPTADPSEAHDTAKGAMAALYGGDKVVVLASADPTHALPVIYGSYLHSSKQQPIYLIADEAPAYLAKMTPALNKIVYQGRHRAFGIAILGQRPAAVDAGIRSQAADTFWMRLNDHVDIDTAKKAIGPDRSAKLQTLKAGEYIRHPE